MEENETKQDHPANELIRSTTIVVCLLLQMAGRTFSQSSVIDDGLFNVNYYSEDFETNSENSTSLECYNCHASEHKDDDNFDARLKDCRDNIATAAIEVCPSYYAVQDTFRYCGVTVQTIQGHVTSFSRGCHYLRPCKELDNCNGVNNTGVCQYCCSSALCNHGNVPSLSVPLMFLVAMSPWIYHFR